MPAHPRRGPASKDDSTLSVRDAACKDDPVRWCPPLRALAAFGVAGWLSLAPSVAVASNDGDLTDAGADVDRWRVHLDVDLASWTRQAPWPRDAGGSPGTRDVIGFIGFRRFGFGFGIGRGFRDVLVVGIRGSYEISRGVQRTPYDVDGPRAVEGHVMPYAELLFVRKHIVRPFAMIRGGIGGALVALDGGSPVDRPKAAASLITPTIGIGLGAHAFVTDLVSIDGLFTIDHRWEYMRLKGGLAGAGDLVASAPSSADDLEARAGHHPFGRRLTVALGIAVSRWF